MAERGGYDPNSEMYNSTREAGGERTWRQERVFKVRRRVATALAGVVALAASYGVARAQEQDVRPVDPTEQSSAEAAKPLELDNLKPGDEVRYHHGIVEIDTTKLNIRKSPVVANDESASNAWKLDADRLVVVNPIYVKSDENGNWYLGVDGEGNFYYWVDSQPGTITDMESGGDADLTASVGGIIRATSTSGIAVAPSEGSPDGDMELAGTITAA